MFVRENLLADKYKVNMEAVKVFPSYKYYEFENDNFERNEKEEL